MNPQDANANPTLAEVYRLFQRNEQASKEHRQEILDSLKEIKEVVYEVRDETSAVRNEVNRHDDEIKGLQASVIENAKDISYFKGREKWILGAFAVILAFGSMLPFFFKLYLKDMITQDISSALQKIQITNSDVKITK